MKTDLPPGTCENASRKKTKKCSPPKSMDPIRSFLNDAQKAASIVVNVAIEYGIRSVVVKRASWPRGPRSVKSEA